MRTSNGIMRIGCALAALMLCGGAAMGQEGEEKKKKAPKKPRPKPVTGVVKSVDFEQKRIVIEIKDQGEKTFTCGAKTSITFAGGIMDGIKDGDTLKIILDPKGENVIRRAFVTRGGAEKEKPAKKTKKKRKKKDEADPPADEGADM